MKGEGSSWRGRSQREGGGVIVGGGVTEESGVWRFADYNLRLDRGDVMDQLTCVWLLDPDLPDGPAGPASSSSTPAELLQGPGTHVDPR